MTAADVDAVQGLLREFVNEMIAHGPESERLGVLLANNRGNTEFVRLAELARRMKRAVRAPEGAAAARAGGGPGPGR
jgi:hypothetical protein